MRIDKWLWAVRVYKTRSQATQACRSGHVKVGGQSVKPSHEVRLAEVVDAQVGPLLRTVKVLGLIERRVGGTAAREFAEDLTPPSEFARARETAARPLFFRPKGLGRPTKKDRRELDKLR